ncbi:MAG: hypothetical protein J7501_05580 [Bdellovibrio sp.]|nr:hypothetical protein [Bdellovibrio sp.]
MASATLTYYGITGASSLDTTTVTKPIMYGGFAGECAANEADNIHTCNSCNALSIADGGTLPFVACNQNNAYPNLQVAIVLTTDTALNAGDLKVKFDDNSVNGNSTAASAGGTVTFTTTWSAICNAATGSSDCSQAINNADMIVTTGTTGGAPFTIKVTTQYVDTSANSSYSDCPNQSSTDPNGGFCNFIAKPGDSKVVPDLTISKGWPAGPNSINFNGLSFFYEEKQGAESDEDTIKRISNTSPSFQMNFSTLVSPPVLDQVISDLTNDVTYCMVMANRDVTGIISLYTPVSTFTTPEQFATLCATPEPVAGLLDDKHCFIATAAFGSDMAPEVQSFREFRNQYLLPFSWGKKFVKAYYHYSPKYAAMISQSETAKTFVRGALWPLLFFARMSVLFGFWTTLIILSLSVLSMIELYRRLVLGRKVRGEL